jgi:amino acid transporter
MFLTSSIPLARKLRLRGDSAILLKAEAESLLLALKTEASSDIRYRFALAMAFVAFLGTVNYVGLRWGSKLQNWTTYLKTAAIGIIVLGAVLILYRFGKRTGFSDQPFSGISLGNMDRI